MAGLEGNMYRLGAYHLVVAVIAVTKANQMMNLIAGARGLACARLCSLTMFEVVNEVQSLCSLG
nr:hypothetical protein Iba_chr14dCG16680 [Ipomoea batatas]